jgi:hypothetical protein
MGSKRHFLTKYYLTQAMKNSNTNSPLLSKEKTRTVAKLEESLTKIHCFGFRRRAVVWFVFEKYHKTLTYFTVEVSESFIYNVLYQEDLSEQLSNHLEADVLIFYFYGIYQKNRATFSF